MTDRIRKLRASLRSAEHHHFRGKPLASLAEQFRREKIPPLERATRRFEAVLAAEKPVVLSDERISFIRTVPNVPELFTGPEWEAVKAEYFVHELGRVFNLCPDYASTIRTGLNARRREVLTRISTIESEGEAESGGLLQSIVRCIDAVQKLSDRYAEEAHCRGNDVVLRTLSRVPRYGARTFHEALQFFRILHYSLWCAGHYHNTVGRFDQYMLSYLEEDLEAGRLEEDSALELLEEFFLSFNRDSDLYPGMQQGDNGQSMVLGGVNSSGEDAYNRLSEMCLKASLELNVIDPKINLRVHRGTPDRVFELASRLTKQGLGFPQYCNDDVVVPGLERLGYEPADARDYVVAACWEFIIPGCSADIPNIGALSFVKVVDNCLRRDLLRAPDFSSFMKHVKEEIRTQVNELTGSFSPIYMEPAPVMSLLTDGAVDNTRDVADGAKYNNYGIHGTGLADAADSLAAIKKWVFDRAELTAADLIDAVDNDFADSPELLARLRSDELKMGNDLDEVDDLGSELLEWFADALTQHRNERGGRYRAGTGSAMYYLSHAAEVGASANGRRRGEPLSANYSPSLNLKPKGPLSVIRSFIKPDLGRVINGGPLTLELHDSVFRTEESTSKVGMLVKSYFRMGGHQLQLNAVNRDRLMAAQKFPDQHRNLIVRVWGWSGYFVELDKEYQDHIIRRAELLI